MKLALLTIFPVATAFTLSPYAQSTRSSILQLGREGNVDFGGNTWKPDSEKMGSTDTGDYFPEGYDPKEQIAFTGGMGGSQGFGGDRGPALPGMENLGADAVLMGGIEEASEIPAGMEFVMSSVPDGSFEMQVASNSKGELNTVLLNIIIFMLCYVLFMCLNDTNIDVSERISLFLIGHVLLTKCLQTTFAILIRWRNSIERETSLHGLRRLLRCIHIRFSSIIFSFCESDIALTLLYML